MVYYSLLFYIASVTSAAVWLVLRPDDTGIRQQVVGMLCLAMGFFGLTAVFNQGERKNWVLPIGLIVLMLLPSFLSLLPQLGLVLVAFIGILGTVALGIVIYRQKLSFWQCIVVSLLGCLIGAYYFLIAQTSEYAPISGDIWILTDSLHNDTVFHSAIASIIHRFNIPSTGLDGIPPLFYHIGNHRWIASCIHFLGGSSVTLLSCARDILQIPIFFFALVSVLDLPQKIQFPWLAPIALTFSYELASHTFDWRSYLTSESHLVSLPILFSFVPIGLHWLKSGIEKTPSGKIKFLPLTTTVISIILCTIAKGSTGLILLTYLVTCFIVPRLLENPKHWLKITLPFLTISVLSLYLIKETLLPKYPIKLFAYYLSFPVSAFFQLIFFCLCIITLWYCLQGFSQLRNAVCLTLAIVFTVGQLPGLLFEIGGGGAWYFSNPTTWLCFIMTGNFIIRYIEDVLHDHGESSKEVNRVALAFITVICFITMSTVYREINYYLLPAFSKNIVVETKNQLEQALSMEGWFSYFEDENSKNSRLQKLSRLIQMFTQAKIALIKHTNLGRLKSIVDQMSEEEKRGTVIYIPPENETYNFWNEDASFTSRPPSPCWARPLAVPAVTGMPLINGVRSGVGDCPFTPYYGMNVYNEDSQNKNLSPHQLCQRANNLGFTKVLIVNEKTYEIHSCER